MIEAKARILETKALTEDVFLLKLRVPIIAAGVQAGQFVHLEAPGFSLRRPFTVAAVAGDSITLIIRRLGAGTEALATTPYGAALRVLGPLGNGFRPSQGTPLLLGGGIGAAALTLLASRLKEGLFIVGGRRRQDLWLEATPLPPGITVKYCTDDGSRGYAGNIVDCAREFLKPGVWVAACGPEPMLASLQLLLKERGIAGQFALEGRMACGLGACMGCACQTIAGPALVCKDGPVFAADQVVFS